MGLVISTASRISHCSTACHCRASNACASHVSFTAGMTHEMLKYLREAGKLFVPYF